MRGTGRAVLDSSTCPAHTIQVQRSWGCASSTSYGTSNVEVQQTPFRLPQRTTVHNLSFSLLTSSQPGPPRRHPTVAAQKQNGVHQYLPSALGSISLSLPHAKPHKHKRKQPASQGVGFEVSDLRPTSTAAREPSSEVSVAASMSSVLSAYSQPNDSTSHAQRPLFFASMSSTCSSQRRKRKAPSIATDTSGTASQSDTQVAVQHSPVMQLAQGTAKAFSRVSEEGEDHRPDLAAAGSKLKKSAMILPRNIRRLLAGAFAGNLQPGQVPFNRSLICYSARSDLLICSHCCFGFVANIGSSCLQVEV